MESPATPLDDPLDALRLERAPLSDRGHSRWLFAAAGAAILAAAAFVIVKNWPRAAEPSEIADASSVAAATSPSASLLDGSGYVVARRQATVSARITGRLVAVLVEEGDAVTAGQIIARLDDTAAQAELALADTGHQLAQATSDAAALAASNGLPMFERSREQLRRSMISAQDHDEAQARYDELRSSALVAARGVEAAAAAVRVARQHLEDTIVRAPFAGIVTVKAAQEGEIVSPSSGSGGFTRTGIGTVVDMDSLEVEVDVAESYIQRVQAGQRAAVRLGAYPDWQIPAHVIAVVPNADRAKATVRVRVALEQRDDRILPNMGARVAFLGAT